MDFVLDASACACWAFVDEDHPAAARALLLAESGTIVVPRLWWFEIRNVLIVNERRKRLTETDTHSFLRWLDAFGITVDHTPNEATVFRLARQYALTVCDSAYLELAVRLGLNLATLDARLAGAARREGIPLVA